MNIKKICEKAGWNEDVRRLRVKRGKSREVGNKKNNNTSYRFCDLASSHMMRRTAITNYLTLGMPEYLVKKISGHSQDSKSFYRYVHLSQTMMDKELESVHQKMAKPISAYAEEIA